MLEFNTLTEIAMRQHYRQQFDDTFHARLAAQDDGKLYKQHMTSLQKLANSGSDAANGDDLISDLSQMGVMK